MKKLIVFLSILSLSTTKNKKYCDIKGYVNNPGVYEVKDNYTIQNIINDAGGLKRNSYTNNINLSKKVTDEMVIYIHSKEEINKIKELNNCICNKKEECIENTDNKTTNTISTEPITDIKQKNTTNKTTTKERTSKTTTKKSTSKTTTTKKSTTKTTTTEQKTTEITTKEISYPININTCTYEELLHIKGLGEKKAQKIIEYRNEFGIFNNIEELKNINGIGDKLFDAIKEFITI